MGLIGWTEVAPRNVGDSDDSMHVEDPVAQVAPQLEETVWEAWDEAFDPDQAGEADFSGEDDPQEAEEEAACEESEPLEIVPSELAVVSVELAELPRNQQPSDVECLAQLIRGLDLRMYSLQYRIDISSGEYHQIEFEFNHSGIRDAGAILSLVREAYAVKKRILGMVNHPNSYSSPVLDSLIALLEKAYDGALESK